jgi:hypothetical protein
MDQLSQQDLFRLVTARKDAASAQQFAQLTKEVMASQDRIMVMYS